MQELEAKRRLRILADQQQAQQVLQELNRYRQEIQAVETLEKQLADSGELLELALMEADTEVVAEVARGVKELATAVDRLELRTLLKGEFDHSNAYLSIHPGAGGTESQDWASMLLRMYTRWAERQNYKVDLIELIPGMRPISATLFIQGENAYGNLRSEKGVHRLVRISPFDASGRRHTSFTSVDITPEFNDEFEIEIRPEELKIDTYRAGGAGGQHVNKTDSAVRITHLPTGIVVACQNERSQFQNKDTAMRLLKAKLAELYRKEQQAKLEQIKGEQMEIAWGSQIRSYIFCPYTMVKDHRTEVETGNLQAVMDGEIDPFIEAFLRSPFNKG